MRSALPVGGFGFRERWRARLFERLIPARLYLFPALAPRARAARLPGFWSGRRPKLRRELSPHSRDTRRRGDDPLRRRRRLNRDHSLVLFLGLVHRPKPLREPIY